MDIDAYAGAPPYHLAAKDKLYAYAYASKLYEG